ncbi:hypothetical protein PHMEG_00023053, partial [Phytophthora megakarya]
FSTPDHEYILRERLCLMNQKVSLHDYIAELQNLLIQCTQQLSPLVIRFYFEEGLGPVITSHLRERHLKKLDGSIDLALRFDHACRGCPCQD